VALKLFATLIIITFALFLEIWLKNLGLMVKKYDKKRCKSDKYYLCTLFKYMSKKFAFIAAQTKS
jgi:hypothetical protein